MKVSKVQLIEEDKIMDKVSNPHTFFSLDSSEQSIYQTFRAKHRELESVVKELKPEERLKREQEVENIFIELFNPYLAQSGLKSGECLIFYGGYHKTLLETPHYVMFERNQPFNISLQLQYWFFTANENLHCSSNFVCNTDTRYEPNSVILQRHLVYDLLRKSIGDKKQDGIKNPITKFGGDFVYFASTDFSRGIMLLTRDILEKIGPEAIKELNVLYREYMDTCGSNRDSYDDKIKQRVFKDAYEGKLEIELMTAGVALKN